MKKKIFIFILCSFSLLFVAAQIVVAQNNSSADFQWGNGFYYNMNEGDEITFNNVEIKLLQIKNHFNQIRIGNDTLWLKVARRSLPCELGGIRIFVADNRNVKELTGDSLVHGLLTKDALVCLSLSIKPLLDPDKYIFPVSFNNGFLWGAEENSYMFSWLGKDESRGENYYRSYEGIGIDLHDARGIEKHWLVSIEDCRVAKVVKNGLNEGGDDACVLLESQQQSGIYYIYNHLYSKNLLVKEGRTIIRGELIGTAWGDEGWGHIQFAIVKSDTVPPLESYFYNVINGFPQVYSLYFGETFNYSRTFTRGRIVFGKPAHLNGNRKNNLAFEDYTGKGWRTGRWNTADKVETVTKGNKGNVRLKKILFEGTPAEFKNPYDYYDYEINIRNGVYRIRAEVGDLYLQSWQKIEFEGVTALTTSLGSGEFEWTTERVVKVKDGRLTVRIYVDKQNLKPAGLREVVFQAVY